MLVKDFITNEIPTLKSFDTGDSVSPEKTVRQEDSVLNALALMARFKLAYVPVVNQEGVCVGYITRETLLEAMADACGMETPGSLIMLDLAVADYSLSDIARIAEANGARIETVLTRYAPSGRMQVLLKIDREDATAVIRGFERFNYPVVYYSMREGASQDSLQQRVAELLYYMEVTK